MYWSWQFKLEKKKKWRNIKDVLEAVPTNYPRLRGQRCLDIAKKAIGQQNPLDQKSCISKDTIFLAEGSRWCHLKKSNGSARGPSIYTSSQAQAGSTNLMFPNLLTPASKGTNLLDIIPSNLCALWNYYIILVNRWTNFPQYFSQILVSKQI